MHFSKLITAFVVVAATCALPSSCYEESNDFAGANLGGGVEGPGFDSKIESFSPIGESSLEASTNAYCIFGKCMVRNSYGRRCPVGYRVTGFRRCGFWRNRIRALCCRHRRRRWAHGTQEGEAESSELEIDQLDG
jgi:hypothetical protein